MTETISAAQKYEYVIWKACKYWYPDRNRRFRLGRISGLPSSSPASSAPMPPNKLWEVFDADKRKWGRVSGNYVIARPAKLKETMEAQE